MNMPSRSYVCRYTADRYNQMDIQRDGKLSEDNRAWNLGHGHRIYHVLGAILKYIEKRNPYHLAVLNMSGMNEGKPDPVLLELLTSNSVSYTHLNGSGRSVLETHGPTVAPSIQS